MEYYNNFGCTVGDITGAYIGSVVSDFGGSDAIQAEMNLSTSDVIMHLHPNILKNLKTINYMELPPLSGSYVLEFPVLKDVAIFRVAKFNPALSGIESDSTLSLHMCGCNSDCTDKKELDSSYLFTDYTVSGDTLTFGSTFDQSRYTYYINYFIDTSRLVLPSLRSIVRDRTAAVLGMQLYSRQDDTWKLVETYQARMEMTFDILSNRKTLAEYAKYSWLNNQEPSSIGSIKIARG